MMPTHETIEALIATNKQLQDEIDRLQTENSQMVAFIAAFENGMTYKADKLRAMIPASRLYADPVYNLISGLLNSWYKLKAQYIKDIADSSHTCDDCSKYNNGHCQASNTIGFDYDNIRNHDEQNTCPYFKIKDTTND